MCRARIDKLYPERAGTKAGVTAILVLTLAAHGQAQPVAEFFDAPVQPADFAAVADLSQLRLSDVVLSSETRVNLDLERFEVLSPDAVMVIADAEGEHSEAPPSVAFFRGRVEGEASSSVFLSVSPQAVYGWVTLRDRRYTVSSGPAGRSLPALVFDETALQTEDAPPGDPDCATDTSGPEWRLEVRPENPGERPAQSRATRCFRVAIDTDVEYSWNDPFNGDVTAAGVYVMTLVAATSEIYMREMDVRLVLAWFRVWNDSNRNADPWDESGCSGQLTQFQNYWNNNMSHVDRALAMLLTGRNLSGCGGLARGRGLCRSNGYALSERNGTFPYPLEDYQTGNRDIYLVPHEFGHLFGAPHTHCMVPPIDKCSNQDDGCWDGNQVCQRGTLMSYCNTCGGGRDYTQIQLSFHDRMLSEKILPYLDGVEDCGSNCNGNTWVEFGYNGDEYGSFAEPFNTVREGAAAALIGGNVYIKTGSAAQTPTIRRPLTLHAWNGVVIIGRN